MTSETSIEDFIFVQALENAVTFGGTANPKALIGKLISKYPQVKQDMQHYTNTINNITEQVNAMDVTEQESKLKELNPQFFEKQPKPKVEKKKDELPELSNHKGEIILRFAPAPSGRLHLGHIYNIVFNYEYKKKYGGKFFVRIEDTNPENIAKENYDAIIEDANWLTDNGVDEFFIQSDRMDHYYDYLKQLIEEGNAYICDCDPETYKTLHEEKTPCPHRKLPVEEQLDHYNNFLEGKYKEGEAAIRFKSDMQHPNPALRDFPIARRKDEPHVRVGNNYCIWPMYNFCAAVDDGTMGINYIIRGKDGEINGVRQDLVKDALGLEKANYYHIGRVKFEDIELSKTRITERILNGDFEGWEDPRVPSIASYRKRGYRPEAFRKMVVASGISKRDSKITSEEYHKSLNFFNKQLIHEKANRYFFIDNPVLVNIKDISMFDSKIELPKHPEDKGRGTRDFKLAHQFYIEQKDAEKLKEGELVRLMHFANFKVLKIQDEKIELGFESEEFDRSLQLKGNIHFLPVDNNEVCEIIQNDNSRAIGICEHLGNIKEESTIQFERYGFCKYEKKEGEKRVFYYIHN